MDYPQERDDADQGDTYNERGKSNDEPQCRTKFDWCTSLAKLNIYLRVTSLAEPSEKPTYFTCDRFNGVQQVACEFHGMVNGVRDTPTHLGCHSFKAFFQCHFHDNPPFDDAGSFQTTLD